MSNELNQNTEPQNTMNNDTVPTNTPEPVLADVQPMSTGTEPLPSNVFNRDFDTDIEGTDAPIPAPTETQPSSVGAESTPRNDFDRDFDTDIDGADSSTNNVPAAPRTIRIDLSFIDPLGRGIKGLGYRIKVGETTHEGITDTKGHAALLEGVEPGLDLEILIKKDNGEWSSKYQGQTISSNMSISIQSPSLKLGITTEEHKGEAQQPKPPKPAAPKPAEVKPPLPRAGEIAKAGPPPAPKTTPTRDEKGHPESTLDAIQDWAGRNLVPTWLHNLLYKDYKEARKQEDAKGGADKANKSTAKPSSGSSNNSTPATAGITNLDQKPPKAVTELIAIMEEQVGWEWKKMFEEDRLTSAAIIGQIRAGLFTPRTGKDAEKSNGRCYPSVKVGLMRATLAKEIWNDIPAKGAGAWLKSQGFIDVTKEIPDARWASPGDIVVYRYDDATEEKNLKKHQAALEKYEEARKEYPEKLKAYEEALRDWKQQKQLRIAAAADKSHPKGEKVKLPAEPKKPLEPQRPNDENYGHIDVRTYDGYLSDFKTKKLPAAAGPEGKKCFVVTGIYRKIYDPLPDIRVRAFLKILREWECHEEPDDSKRYFMLFKAIDGSRRFSDTSKHPCEGVRDKDTAAGAYQFILKTYRQLSDAVYGIGSGFSPAKQDRLAIAYLEILPGNPLALIRMGKIREATEKINNIWASLPGHSQGRKEMRNGKPYVFTMDDLVQRHQLFMNELLGIKK